MSRLDELIQQYCPDGVEYVELGNKDYFDFHYGKGNKIPEDNSGKYAVYGANGIVSHINEYNCEDISIIGHIGAVGMVQRCKDKCFVTYNGTIAQPTNREKISSQYLYYLLTTLNLPSYKKGNQPFLSVSDFSHISVPVPPLPVQEEIIRILDTFTALTAELQIELQTRKRQYKYYCRRIIEEAQNSEMLSISQWGKWFGGSTPSMAKNEFWENGTIPWVSSKDMKVAELYETEDHITVEAIKNTSLKLLPNNIVAIVARSGILKHTLPIVFIPINVTVNQDIKALVTNDRVLPKYAFFALQGYHDELLAKTKKQGGTVDSLDIQKFMEFKIPIPSLQQQERIISTLDRFNSLCNDLSSGLPAEIAARQKQYEYYRDKLLTFKQIA